MSEQERAQAAQEHYVNFMAVQQLTEQLTAANEQIQELKILSRINANRIGTLQDALEIIAATARNATERS